MPIGLLLTKITPWQATPLQWIDLLPARRCVRCQAQAHADTVAESDQGKETRRRNRVRRAAEIEKLKRVVSNPVIAIDVRHSFAENGGGTLLSGYLHKLSPSRSLYLDFHIYLCLLRCTIICSIPLILPEQNPRFDGVLALNFL
jgi:hypothetical protein